MKCRCVAMGSADYEVPPTPGCPEHAPQPPSAANPPPIDDAMRYLRDVVLPEADAHESAALLVLLARVAPKSGQAGQEQGVRSRGRGAEPDDYLGTYETFWRGLVETDGRLDPDKVARELHDYSHMLHEVPEVYAHITGDRMSKPNYYARDVCSEADEHYAEIARADAEEMAAAQRKDEAAAAIAGLRAAGFDFS